MSDAACVVADDRQSSSPPNEWREGWKALIAAACGVSFGYALFMTTAGLFIAPMQAAFGWSRTAVAIGPIVGIASALLNPVAGLLVDRFGARPIALTGFVGLSGGYMLLASVPPDPLRFFVIAFVIAALGAVTNPIVFFKVIATWFPRNLGTAVALTLSCGAVFGAILLPILAGIITHDGWRAGYRGLAVLVAAAGVPAIAAWLRENPDHRPGAPSSEEAPPGAAVKEALCDRRFWLSALAFGLAAGPVGGFNNHLQPLLVGRGLAAGTAAEVGSALLVSATLGRMAAGILLDHATPRLVAPIYLSLAAGGTLMLWAPGTATLTWFIAGAALIGLILGAEGAFISYYTFRMFGLHSYSTLLALMYLLGGLATAGGGLAFAALFDAYKNYDVASLASAGVFLAAGVIAATIRLR